MPISVNDYLQVGIRTEKGRPKGYFYESKAARDFKEYLSKSAEREVSKCAWDIEETKDGLWYIDIDFRFPSKQRIRDKDPNNYLKVLLDGFTGIVYADDNNILSRIQNVTYNTQSGFDVILHKKGDE